MFISQEYYRDASECASSTPAHYEGFHSIRDKLNAIEGVIFTGANVTNVCRINMVCTQSAFPQLLLILKALTMPTSVNAESMRAKLHVGIYGRDIIRFEIQVPENIELVKQAFEQAIDNRVNYSEDGLCPSEENMKLVNELAARAHYKTWIDHVAGKDYAIQTAAILKAMRRFKEISTVDLSVHDTEIRGGRYTRTLAIINYWSAKGFKTYCDLYNALDICLRSKTSTSVSFTCINTGIIAAFSIVMPLGARGAAQSIFQHHTDEILSVIKEVQDATDKSMLSDE